MGCQEEISGIRVIRWGALAIAILASRAAKKAEMAREWSSTRESIQCDQFYAFAYNLHSRAIQQSDKIVQQACIKRMKKRNLHTQTTQWDQGDISATLVPSFSSYCSSSLACS